MSSREEMIKVFIPGSQIKSPGALFKDKKDPFEVRTNQKHISDLLGCFKEKIESPFTSFANIQTIPTIPTDRPVPHKNSKLLMEKILKSQSMEAAVCPGKLKTLSDKICNITQKTKEILCVYGLELTVEDSKITKDVYNLFKALIPEICFFPSDFFKNLKISQLFICKDEDSLLLTNKENISLSVLTLDTKQKVRQRIHKIIFDHLILSNSEIIKKWREYDFSTGSSGDALTKLEEVFMSLMENTNHSLLKTEPQKLRELLALQYPEAMSEERFKERNKERKRTYKVRFVSESCPI